MWGSELRPGVDEVVAHAGQLDHRGVVGCLGGEALDGDVHVSEERSLRVVPDEALQPEEGAKVRATGYRRDGVEAGRRIQEHRTGRPLHGPRAAGVLDDEFIARPRPQARSSTGRETSLREL